MAGQRLKLSSSTLLGMNATHAMIGGSTNSFNGTVTVPSNAGATAINIPSPTTSRFPITSVIINTLPTNGVVTLADGVTPVTIGQNVGLSGITTLKFIPNPGLFSTGSTLSYTTADILNESSSATETITIGPHLGPTSPTVVGIASGSDTGVAGDLITSVTQPAITGTGTTGDTVSLYDGTNTTPIGTAVVANGAWSITPSVALGDGPHNLTATQTDSTNAVSAASASLTLTIDTTTPAVTAALTSDTGSSNNDNITSDDTLSGTGDANATVTLTEGATVIGSTTADGSGAWSFTPILSDGPHTVTASETNTAGNTGAATLSFTLDTTTPAVTAALTSDTGISGSDNITSDDTLSGTGDANATVTLTEGATVLGSTTADGSGAWTFTPTLSDGSHTITASETNTAGNTGTATLSFTLDTTTPAVTAALTSDTGSSNNDNVTSDDTLNGTGDANATVTLTEGATVLGSTTADGSGAWSFTPTLSDGPHTVTASETDTAGNTGTATLSFTLDTTAPVVTEALAHDTGISDSDNITSDDTLSGTGDANATVTLTEGATVLGSTTADGSGAWTFTPTLSDGPHTVTASETNTAGNTGAASLAFTLNTTAPTVTAALTSDTGSSNSDNITSDDTLSGTGDANATVTLTEGATVLGSTTADGSGAWSFTPTLSDGPHTVTASETNTAGNTGAATLSFTLDTTTPAVTAALTSDTGSSGSDNITSDDTLSGTGDANATVTLTEGATVLGSTTADGSGAWTFTPTLSDGAHTIVASETDTAGNTGTATLAFTLDTAPPATPASLSLAVASDSGVLGDDITKFATPTLTGTGETGDTVTLYDGAVAIGTAAVVNGNWSIMPEAALSDGSHSLTVRQTDMAGNVSAASAVLPLVIDTTLPAAPSGIALAAGSDSGVPGDGITSGTHPVITGMGEAGDIVRIYENANLTGSTTVAPDGAWSFTAETTLADGAYSVTATQTDPAGNVSAPSAAFALTIDTTPPAVTAALAANPHNTASVTYNQVLDGGGDPNARVAISDGGVAIGAAQADAAGAWSFDLAGLAAGSHSLVASETDAAGNTGTSAPVPLTVDPSVVPDTRFTVATASTMTSGLFFGSDYHGPLPGLQAQYGYAGTDNANVVANVANTFIYSGTAGEDALVAKAGSNVLDSRGGSDWMIGASGADGGMDTFFVDSRATGSPTTWDTALNFHVGDKLTIWDFSPTAGSMSFIDNLGQPGYTGATLLANLGNGATDLVTFAGLSSANTQFATSTGASGGLGYLAVTRVA